MKTNLRLLKRVLFGTLGLLLIVLLLLTFDGDYQPVVLSETDKNAIKARKEYLPDADSGLYYSLLEHYGKNKTLAEGFEIQCLLALSHYPELKETPIEFQVQSTFPARNLLRVEFLFEGKFSLLDGYFS